MKLLSLFVIAAAAGIALSACPNACSGHGTCNLYDECTCYNEGKTTYFGALYDTAKGYERIKEDAKRDMQSFDGGYTGTDTNSVGLSAYSNAKFLSKTAFVQKQFGGPDCSLLFCPRGVSWTAPFSTMGDALYKNAPDGTNKGSPSHSVCKHADFVECSDAGMCDRSSGTCTCNPGFEGAACQRTQCPNSCSGHGKCQSNIEFSKDGSLARAYTSETTEYFNDRLMTEDISQVDPRKTYLKAWDSGIQFGCKCDVGFRGEDCSMLECPSTMDPLGYHGNESGEDCSGRGLCDYTSGTCTCFAGFTGTDCGTVEALA